MKLYQLIAVLILSLSMTACSGFGKKLKSWISGENPTQPQQQRRPASFSDSSTLMPGARRAYRRTTKKSLEDTSRVDAKSGSLWVMEGQGAYLFSENVVRMIGDAMAVRIDGEPKEQLETKVKVIRNLITKIELRKASLNRRLASEKTSKDPKAANQKAGAANKPTTNAKTAATGAAAEEAFKVKAVPTRITERMIDGNYRVKGSQPFMIGRYEYKVIVTGVIRAEDFNEEGVSATKLLDPKFDIVSAKRSTQSL